MSGNLVESVNLQVECFGTVNVQKKTNKKVVQDIFRLCLRAKRLDNATVLFGSKAPPLLLLWPRHESRRKVQAREISTLEMSSDEKGGCKKCKFYCFILVPGLMKGAKELCYHALFKGISNNLITLLYTYSNQRHKTCWQKCLNLLYRLRQGWAQDHVKSTKFLQLAQDLTSYILILHC